MPAYRHEYRDRHLQRAERVPRKAGVGQQHRIRRRTVRSTGRDEYARHPDQECPPRVTHRYVCPEPCHRFERSDYRADQQSFPDSRQRAAASRRGAPRWRQRGSFARRRTRASAMREQQPGSACERDHSERTAGAILRASTLRTVRGRLQAPERGAAQSAGHRRDPAFADGAERPSCSLPDRDGLLRAGANGDRWNERGGTCRLGNPPFRSRIHAAGRKDIRRGSRSTHRDGDVHANRRGPPHRDRSRWKRRIFGHPLHIAVGRRPGGASGCRRYAPGYLRDRQQRQLRHRSDRPSVLHHLRLGGGFHRTDQCDCRPRSHLRRYRSIGNHPALHRHRHLDGRGYDQRVPAASAARSAGAAARRHARLAGAGNGGQILFDAILRHRTRRSVQPQHLRIDTTRDELQWWCAVGHADTGRLLLIHRRRDRCAGSKRVPRLHPRGVARGRNHWRVSAERWR